MKFSCTQENLEHALALVSRVAQRGGNLPILQNILIEANDTGITIAGTNLEIGIRAKLRGKVDAPGAFTVPAQLLANYVSLLPNDRVDCEQIDKQLHIRSVNEQTVIKGEDSTDFPLLPGIEQQQRYTFDRLELERSIQQTLVAAAVDETRPEIAGVLFSFLGQELRLAATDSYRLAEKVVVVKTSSGSAKVILPQRSAQELLRVLQTTTTPEIELTVSDTQLACSNEEVDFVSRVVEGVFPDYTQIIPQNSNTSVVVTIKELMKAVKGAALFSKTGINDVQFVISSTDQNITIRAVNAQLGENQIVLAAPVQGEDITVVFNYRYVLDALQQVQNQPGTTMVELRVVSSMAPVVFRSDGDATYTYIIMPIKQ